MTLHHLGELYVRLGNALLTTEDQNWPLHKPLLDSEQVIGAALFWSWLRDLFTATPHDIWTRDEILVLLETLSRDTEMFPPGAIGLIADCEAEEAP